MREISFLSNILNNNCGHKHCTHPAHCSQSTKKIPTVLGFLHFARTSRRVLGSRVARGASSSACSRSKEWKIQKVSAVRRCFSVVFRKAEGALHCICIHATFRVFAVPAATPIR
jgi:hypothetical protein